MYLELLSVKVEHMSDRTIRASEIADYLYCRRAWWLSRVEGYDAKNVRVLEGGHRYHGAHGRLVGRSLLARRLSYLFVFLAVAVFVFLLMSNL